MFLVTRYLGQHLQTVDNTIIATAIPKITSVFKSLDDVGWQVIPVFNLFLQHLACISQANILGVPNSFFAQMNIV